MDKQLNALLKDCMAYLNAYQELLKKNSVTAAHAAYYEKVQQVVPALQKALKAIAPETKATIASELEQNSSKSSTELEKRFRELLEKANVALLKKGLAAISLPSDTFIA